MKTLQLQKERQLRHLDEDFQFKITEMQKELDKKNEILDEEDERQA